MEKENSVKPPFKIKFLSTFSLIFSFILIGALLYVAYLIWNVIFYILSLVIIIGFVYRSISKDDGIILIEEENPKLFNLVNSIAKKVGTRIPDKLILTQDSSIGVSGIFERKLSIGIATLKSLSTQEFTSILFHEFAHYKGLDNIIGTSLMKTTLSFRDIVNVSSYTHMYIYLPLLIFYYIFATITLLYSRQREYLADWVAASFVGGQTFSDSLKKYVKLAIHFDSKINLIIQHYASKNLILKNIYDAHRTVEFAEEFEKDIYEKMKKEFESSSLFSTHPSTKSRIERIKNIKEVYLNQTGQCSNLFKNLDREEEKLTEIIYKKILRKK